MNTSFENQMLLADPAADLPALTDEQRRRIFADALLETPRRSVDTSRMRKATRRAPSHSLRWATVGAVAAVAAGAFLFSSTGPTGATAYAQEVLGQAAIHAVDPPAAPGQYWKITSTGTSLAVTGSVDDPQRDAAFLTSFTNIDYIDVTGDRPDWHTGEPSRVIRQLTGAPGTIMEEATSTSAFTTGIASNDTPGSWGNPTQTWLASVPRDPGQLRALLDHDVIGHGNDPLDEVFVYIADALRTGRIPADLRSSMFEVLKGLPGTDVTDRAAALGDHTGVAIGRPGAFDGEHREIVIDPDSGQVLGERYRVQLQDGDKTQDVALETSYTRELVDDIPASVLASADRLNCIASDDGPIMCHD